jgi:hypothetical protein
MYKINKEITASGFELIKIRIGQILLEELAHQYTFQNDPSLSVNEVFYERNDAFDSVECPAINVMFSRNEFTKRTQISSTVESEFLIDFYSSSPTIGSADGEKVASGKLNRLMAVAYGILQNPIYNTLGFEAGMIENITLEKMVVGSPVNTKDANSMAIGRITMKVRYDSRFVFNDLPLNIAQISSVVFAGGGVVQFKY